MSFIRNGVDTTKTVLRNAFHLAGFDLVPFPRLSRGKMAYAPVTPFATYSPWNLDERFLETYDLIKSHTLVDLYRCYELWTLVEQSAKVPGSIIEIGVWRGGTGALIARKAELCGLDCTVYLCDTFSGVVKAGAADLRYKGGEHADTSRKMVEELVFDRLKLKNVRILQGIFPDETAAMIEDRHNLFRLCHVDVDVYQSAKDIVEWMWTRMAVGGMVVFDDYGTCGCEGITKLVNEQAREIDRLVFHNLNGHAVAVKIAERGPAGACATV